MITHLPLIIIPWKDTYAMKHGVALLSVVLLLVAIVHSVPASAELLTPRTWGGVTVVTTTGWEYVDVQVRWLAEQRLLEVIRSDGARRNFTPEEIRVVLDAEGRDVTQAILSGRPDRRQPVRVPSHPAFSEPLPADGRGSAVEIGGAPLGIGPGQGFAGNARVEDPVGRRFAFALAANLGYGWSQEDWQDPFEEGIAYDLKIRAAFSSTTYLLVGYRRQEMKRPRTDYGFARTLEQDIFLAGLGFMKAAQTYGQVLPYLELAFARVSQNRRPTSPYFDEPAHPVDPFFPVVY